VQLHVKRSLQNNTTLLLSPVDFSSAIHSTPRRAYIEKLQFAATMVLSACLLFLVQPIIAKIILPWFGGSAGVWTGCMVFFQVTLLLGYLYAHCLTTRFSPAQQKTIHIAILIASVAFLHFASDSQWKPEADREPIASILIVLAHSVGLPYFVLSTTSPLLQNWLGRTSSGTMPYRFYALSNFGSLVALGLYPLFIEPFLDTSTQLKWWSTAYVVFVVLGIIVSVRGGFRTQTDDRIGGEQRLTVGQACWLTAIAACSSSLLLSVSNSLSQDIAPIPFLWILPLGLYLLTFILCFDNSRWHNIPMYRVVLPPALVALMFVQAQAALPVWVVIAVHCVGLFIACMFCHSLLAAARPAVRDLTAYYLSISLGGVLGSIFVAIAAPLLFNQLLEFKVAIAACVLIALNRLYGYSSRIFLGVCASAVLLVPLLLDYVVPSGETIVNARNFYGTLSVSQLREPSFMSLSLYHGRILHGAQYSENQGSPEPSTYYGQESGVGLTLRRTDVPQRVGIVGLGAGTLAWYGNPHDYYRFYEINPLVERLARKYFTYMSGSNARVDVVIADGRNALTREPDQRFDTIVLDAFSGDSIPVHLLTVEAFSCYFRHLKPGGVLAIHISNQYLDLAPIVEAVAGVHRKRAWIVRSPENRRRHWSAADWVLISDNEPFITHLQERGQAVRIVKGTPNRKPWTDKYSNLLSALK
jgi:SAM-dependent methyltransferase